MPRQQPTILVCGVLCLLLALLLSGCATPRSYAAVQQTARVVGCWPASYPTPNSVTVTPDMVAPQQPSTVLPTTTPYPPCPPAPGETAVVYPTRVPTSPPFPTMEPEIVLTGSDTQTTMHLPGHLYQVDVAVHPTENWPAVITVARFVESTEPMQVFARVYNPQTRTWNVAQQLDIGASSTGNDRYGSAVIGITGDRTIHAVWGSSDEGQQRIWTSASRDFGLSWSAPAPIARDCWHPLDMATTRDNQIVVLLACAPGRPSVAIGTSDGPWRQEWIAGSSGQFGAITLLGDGDTARLVVLLSELRDTDALTILSRPVSGSTAWQQVRRRLPRTAGDTGALLWQQQIAAFTRPDGTAGLLVTWPAFEAGVAYALVSFDGGQSWGEIETVAQYTDGRRIGRVVPAYDPAADRLVAIWTCCGKAKEQSTHYASWSVPGSGQWSPAMDAPAVPLVLGARAVDALAVAQAANSRMVWLAWVEREHQVDVRSFDLNTTIPVDQYPVATPVPTIDEGIRP